MVATLDQVVKMAEALSGKGVASVKITADSVELTFVPMAPVTVEQQEDELLYDGPGHPSDDVLYHSAS